MSDLARLTGAWIAKSLFRFEPWWRWNVRGRANNQEIRNEVR